MKANEKEKRFPKVERLRGIVKGIIPFDETIRGIITANNKDNWLVFPPMWARPKSTLNREQRPQPQTEQRQTRTEQRPQPQPQREQRPQPIITLGDIAIIRRARA